MLANKDIRGYLTAFEGLAHRIITVPVPDDDLATNAAQRRKDWRKPQVSSDSRLCPPKALLKH